MKANQLMLAATLAGAIGVVAADKSVAQKTTMPSAVKLPIEGEMPSLGGATGWLNSQPLTTAGLRGKVVLIDFWTYTCINWLRTLPYVRAWAEKYQNQGLAVIGVHSPEFAFEKNLDNVRRSARDMRVNYPQKCAKSSIFRVTLEEKQRCVICKFGNFAAGAGDRPCAPPRGTRAGSDNRAAA
jgi:thiol-disulfide isomerase/thioredoxin